MTQTAMTPLRRRMIDDMTIRNLAASTRKIYVLSVANFSAYHGRSPDQLSFEDVRDYQLHLVARGLKATSICQIMSALRFLGLLPQLVALECAEGGALSRRLWLDPQGRGNSRLRIVVCHGSDNSYYVKSRLIGSVIHPTDAFFSGSKRPSAHIWIIRRRATSAGSSSELVNVIGSADRSVSLSWWRSRRFCDLVNSRCNPACVPLDIAPPVYLLYTASVVADCSPSIREVR